MVVAERRRRLSRELEVMRVMCSDSFLLSSECSAAPEIGHPPLLEFEKPPAEPDEPLSAPRQAPNYRV